MLKSFKLFSLGIAAVLFAAAGCAQQDGQDMQNMGEDATADIMASSTNVNQAVAVIHPLGESGISGTATFTKVDNGVRVRAQVEGLTEGRHGFHIHQYGDCSSPDGSSAGGHYNPADNPHGAPADAERHMGDMGNIEANAQGQATMEYVDDTIQLSSIIGRGVIVHGGTDDLTSQPSGAAGPRLACGEIGIANPE